LTGPPGCPRPATGANRTGRAVAGAVPAPRGSRSPRGRPCGAGDVAPDRQPVPARRRTRRAARVPAAHSPGPRRAHCGATTPRGGRRPGGHGTNRPGSRGSTANRSANGAVNAASQRATSTAATSSRSNPVAGTPLTGEAVDRYLATLLLLRDAENHHRRGVHDAHEDLGEPGCRIGKVSPTIGKVPETPDS
jgi:hypothetical protein